MIALPVRSLPAKFTFTAKNAGIYHNPLSDPDIFNTVGHLFHDATSFMP
jgi:hypothetical protein